MIFEVFVEKFLIRTGKLIMRVISFNRYSTDLLSYRQQGILGLLGLIFWISIVLLLLKVL